MKAIKRTVAALLATLMLATSTSFTLAAETYTDDEAVVVAKVNAAGIMTGTDKGFEPSKSLTRAEAAAIIVRMKGISESAVKTASGTTLFTDVAASHWASGYVNQASNLGIVKGVSATEFAPDREVTIAEFTTMAVRALGAGQLVDSEGVWPTNYVNFANENGILDDVNAIYTATATRLQAATIVANTLEAVMWEKSAVKTNGEITWQKSLTKDTILDDVLNYVEVKFTVDKVSNKDQEITVSKTDGYAKFVAGIYDVNEAFDLSTVKVGLEYTGYYDIDEDEIRGMWIESDSTEFAKIKASYSSSKFNIKLDVDGKEREYEFKLNDAKNALASDVVIKINEANVAATALVKEAGIFGSIVLNEDNKIVAVYATQYDQFGVVDEVTKNKVEFKSTKVKTAEDEAAADITIDDDKYEYFFTKDGNGIKVTDLKEGDAVAYYYVSADKKFVGEVMTNVVEGEVSSINTTTVKVDGKKYEGFITGLKVEDEIKAYINSDGRIAFYEEVEGAADDLALVSYSRLVKGKYGDDYEVKLLLTDGTETETLLVDLVESYEELGFTTDATTTEKETAVRTWISTNLKATDGQLDRVLVEYEINGDKVILGLPATGDDKDYDDANKLLTVNRKVTTLGDFVITEETKLIRLKGDDEFGIKYEVVDYDDLDTVETAKKAIVVGIDDDTKEVDAVYFDINYGIKRASKSTNFVFVTEVSESKVNDKLAFDVTGYTLDGKDFAATYCKDEADEDLELTTSNYSTKLLGKVFDFVVADDMIMSVEKHTESDDLLTSFTYYTENKKMYLNKVLSNRIELVDDNTTVAYKTELLADDVLVILDKADGKYAVKDFNDIDKYEIVESALHSDEITAVWTYKEDTNAQEALVIVYKDTYKD